MSKLFLEFTDKIECLFRDIIALLGQLPRKVFGNLFYYGYADDLECLLNLVL